MNKTNFDFLGKPESETLEYKLQIPQIQLTSRLLSAFANTKGGRLVIGVNDDGIPVGVENPDVVQNRINLAAERILPKIVYSVEVVEIDGKPIVIATVEKGINAIYKIGEDIYQRIGERTIKSDLNLIGLNVYISSIQAVTSGAVAMGAGSVAVGEQGVLVGGDIAGTIVTGDQNTIVSESVKNAEIIEYDTAFERLAGNTSFVVDQLRVSYELTREQSSGWFRFSIIAAILGFFLIGIGATIAILGQTTAAIITTISSIIPNVAAALFFAQSKAANERVDTILAQLSEARQILTSVEIANTIDNAKVRNSIKVEIVRNALQIENSKAA